MLSILYQKLNSYKNENNDDLIFLIDKFHLLINKYSKKLQYEDAKQDMIVEFIKIVQKLPLEKEEFKDDKYIVGYITKALNNNYILLNKKRLRLEKFEICSEFFLDVQGEYDKNLNGYIVKDCLSSLSNKENYIITQLILNGKTATEIAKEYNISRQAINQTKIRALNKLKAIMM